MLLWQGVGIEWGMQSYCSGYKKKKKAAPDEMDKQQQNPDSDIPGKDL